MSFKYCYSLLTGEDCWATVGAILQNCCNLLCSVRRRFQAWILLLLPDQMSADHIADLLCSSAWNESLGVLCILSKDRGGPHLFLPWWCFPCLEELRLLRSWHPYVFSCTRYVCLGIWGQAIWLVDLFDLRRYWFSAVHVSSAWTLWGLHLPRFRLHDSHHVDGLESICQDQRISRHPVDKDVKLRWSNFVYLVWHRHRRRQVQILSTICSPDHHVDLLCCPTWYCSFCCRQSGGCYNEENQEGCWRNQTGWNIEWLCFVEWKWHAEWCHNEEKTTGNLNMIMDMHFKFCIEQVDVVSHRSCLLLCTVTELWWDSAIWPSYGKG